MQTWEAASEVAHPQAAASAAVQPAAALEAGQAEAGLVVAEADLAVAEAVTVVGTGKLESWPRNEWAAAHGLPAITFFTGIFF
jgi:hypothetical protein